MDENYNVGNPVPQEPQNPQTPPTNGFAIAALVCGILCIIGAWIPVVTYFTVILAVLGIVFGVKGQKIAKETNSGKGLATAGLVLGIIGAAFAVIGIICIACIGIGAASLGAASSL